MSMFLRTDLVFDSPICSCTPVSFIWSIYTVDSLPNLSVECRTCHTKIVVPNSKFIGAIKVESPSTKNTGEATKQPNSRLDLISDPET